MNILNKLTIKHLKMNKKRTVVTIIGIILSTALMVGIGLLMSTVRENMIDMVKQENGTQHAIIYNLSQDDLSHIKNNNNVNNWWGKVILENDNLKFDLAFISGWIPYEPPIKNVILLLVIKVLSILAANSGDDNSFP